ncbi:hypothetical protein [Sphingomonas sp.]|uniref:DUF6894 family protein n=1 Tax=Sphingomonas sp. TaxID=28214 RepID=UPI0025E6422F|nr:hypothetical protein [Sphingomonas sp.]
MARYFFDLHNGSGLTRDEEGRELEDNDEARREALVGIRSVLGAEVANGSIDLDGRMEVLNENREILFTIPFSDAVAVNQPK